MSTLDYDDTVDLSTPYLWDEEIKSQLKQRMGCLLVEAAYTFWNEQALFDYTIKVEDEEFAVHKFVFAAVSDFFRTMLSGSMCESEKNYVELKGVTKAGFNPILHHLYTNQPLDLNKDNVVDILGVASILQIQFIMNACVRYLSNIVNEDNCVDILNVTYMFQDCNGTSLGDMAVNRIVEHLDILIKEEELPRLSAEALKRVLSQHWLERSELALLDIVKSWVYYDEGLVEVRLREVAMVLEEVRFALIRPEQLKRLPEQYPFLSSLGCQKLINECMAYQNEKMYKRVLLQTKKTSVRDEPTVVAFGGLYYTNCNEERSKQSNNMFALGEVWDAVEGFHLPNTTYRGASVAVVNNFLIVCGGLKDIATIPAPATSKCFIFDPRISRWDRIGSLCHPRTNFALVAHQEELFAFGGDNNAGTFTDVVEKYSFKTNKWQIIAKTTKRLSGPTACSFDDKIYLLGGKYHENGRERITKDMAIFDPVKCDWSLRPEMKSAQNRCVVFQMFEQNQSIPNSNMLERSLCVVAHNGKSVHSFFPESGINWQRNRLKDRLPSGASVVCIHNLLYFVNGWVTTSNGRRKYGVCCEYNPNGRLDEYGYPSNRPNASELPQYPEEVDDVLCCVMAPNFYLRKEIPC